MKITHVLLDMDGVLADFFSLALARLNARYPQSHISPKEYVIQHANFNMAEVFGITATQFWDTIEGNFFWSDLARMRHALELIDKLKTLDIPFTIASSPSYHPSCIPEKISWLKQMLGIKMTECMFGSAKHLMAKPDVLLIDDLQKNVDKFIAAGGQAVCVPSNWNTLDLDFNTIWNKIEPKL